MVVVHVVSAAAAAPRGFEGRERRRCAGVVQLQRVTHAAGNIPADTQRHTNTHTHTINGRLEYQPQPKASSEALCNTLHDYPRMNASAGRNKTKPWLRGYTHSFTHLTLPGAAVLLCMRSLLGPSEWRGVLDALLAGEPEGGGMAAAAAASAAAVLGSSLVTLRGNRNKAHTG